jgi:hypothetical protein
LVGIRLSTSLPNELFARFAIYIVAIFYIISHVP